MRQMWHREKMKEELGTPHRAQGADVAIVARYTSIWWRPIWYHLLAGTSLRLRLHCMTFFFQKNARFPKNQEPRTKWIPQESTCENLTCFMRCEMTRSGWSTVWITVNCSKSDIPVDHWWGYCSYLGIHRLDRLHLILSVNDGSMSRALGKFKVSAHAYFDSWSRILLGGFGGLMIKRSIGYIYLKKLEFKTEPPHSKFWLPETFG